MGSLTGELLKAIRLKKNLSSDRAQYRIEPAGLSLEAVECNPERVPMDHLIVYLKAIEMTAEEYLNFLEVVRLEFGDSGSSKAGRSAEILQIIATLLEGEEDEVGHEAQGGLEHIRKGRRLKSRKKNDNDCG